MKTYRGRFMASLDAQQSITNTREIVADTGESFVVSDIQIFPVGSFDSHHQDANGFEITNEKIAEFVENFYNGVGTTDGTLPVYVTHDSSTDRPAAGWVIDLIDRGMKGLWATVKWNKYGLEQIRNELYKFISPEWAWEYVDPRDSKKYENVLFAPALVNEPYFNSMPPVTASEVKNTSEIINVNIMDLQSILSKKVEDLTQEEVSFLREHSAELSDEQKSAFSSILEANSEESEEKKEEAIEEVKQAEHVEEKATEQSTEKQEEPKTEEAQPVEQVADQAPVEAEKVEAKQEETMTASEQTVRMTAAEHARLIMEAKEGREAKQELLKTKIATRIEAMEHVPATKQVALELALELDEEKREKMLKMLASIQTQVKREKASSSSSSGVYSNVVEEVRVRRDELMKNDPSLDMAAAQSKLFASDADLAARYINR